jgi:hypothetical protein
MISFNISSQHALTNLSINLERMNETTTEMRTVIEGSKTTSDSTASIWIWNIFLWLTRVLLSGYFDWSLIPLSRLKTAWSISQLVGQAIVVSHSLSASLDYPLTMLQNTVILAWSLKSLFECRNRSICYRRSRIPLRSTDGYRRTSRRLLERADDRNRFSRIPRIGAQ